MDKIFHRFCEQEVRKKDSYYTNIDDFVEHIKHWNLDYENLGGYNTYNGESCLDKTLQWNIFAIYNGIYEGHYMILQTHNGCDVRGGYSAPHIFRFDEDEFWCWLNDLTARCPNHGEEIEKETVQTDLDGNKIPSLDHVDCYSDDC